MNIDDLKKALATKGIYSVAKFCRDNDLCRMHVYRTMKDNNRLSEYLKKIVNALNTY
jgi:hypothetical protein